MDTKDILDWAKIAQSIITILAIIGGGIWSWFQFSIGDLLKPNFTLKVTLVSISTLASSKLLVVRITVKNIGRTTIEHSDSNEIFSFCRSHANFHFCHLTISSANIIEYCISCNVFSSFLF